jgi:multiple sugar transport system permease protein
VKGKTITPFLFLIPAFLFLIGFVFYPIVDTIYMSFLKEGTGEFVGFENYLDVISRNEFLNVKRLANFLGGPSYGALIHNILWVAIHLPLCVFFGLLLAVLLRDVKGGTIIKSTVFMGMVIPMIVGGVLLRFILDKDAGILNGVLNATGLGAFARDWTFYPDTALITAILGSVWIWVGFSMIVYSAGLEGIPVELYEAAKIDGASWWKTFWRITVPMLKPATIVVVTMTLLWELKVFDIVYAVTQGGPGDASKVLAYIMYIDAFQAWDFGTASATAVILTVMTFGFAAYLVSRMAKS